MIRRPHERDEEADLCEVGAAVGAGLRAYLHQAESRHTRRRVLGSRGHGHGGHATGPSRSAAALSRIKNENWASGVLQRKKAAFCAIFENIQYHMTYGPPWMRAR